MLPVPLVQVLLKDQQIRQGYRKIVYFYILLYMLSAILHQLSKSANRLFFVSKLSVCQSLIIDHFGRLVVVIHHAHRLRLSVTGFRKTCESFLCLSQLFPHQSKQIMQIILLGRLQFPFSQILGIFIHCLQENCFGFYIFSFCRSRFCQLIQGGQVLGCHFAFAAFPLMELPCFDQIESLLRFSQSV